jgi:hypothetical protein
MRQLNDDFLAERAEWSFDQERFTHTKPSQATWWLLAGLCFGLLSAAIAWWRR